MAYISNQGARADLWTFGARAYADCISATLSQNNVLPNGTYVEFDYEGYLMGDYEEMRTETNMSPTATPNGVASPS